ncbi:exodeoxyribonuclease V subunit alpha [Nitrincola nitratireducens]|uniref:RecBCD enzyme subunit RecD n=1 Tax=Nitrincola nitratireducens TaxID=1229521 RepID=W9V0M2_9GAMM|nr:exodeoxyribonuclease V subunit alpha [Nitrincola nitratireducens]EXJ12864.1 Exodeoxyribonuclease V alpha chain [Nitrincola nitratireducens]
MKSIDALQDSTFLIQLLESWAEAGWLRWLDVEVARFFQEMTEDASPLLILAIALTSHQNGRGHVCFDLKHALDAPESALLLPPENAQSTPQYLPQTLFAHISLDQWFSALQHPRLVSEGSGNSPLVLGGTQARPLLYLRRFWQHEQSIKQAIESRLSTQYDLPISLLSDSLNRLFPQADVNPDWQKIACALAARQGFSIITGGPGTGKTTTVVKLLALLQQVSLTQQGRPLSIRLAAPTGKAAARLNASIASQVKGLDLSSFTNEAQIRQDIPTEVTTLHRLLGPLRNSRFFRHHRGNPLRVDLVVVDEASMIDVELMAQLLDALPAEARLILLGDKDQLASVEAGAVLGNLCHRAEAGHYTPDTQAWLANVTQQTLPDAFLDANGTRKDQAITMLRHSYRFGDTSGIGQLARRVNQAEQPNTSSPIHSLFDQFPDIQRILLNSTDTPALNQLLCTGYGAYLNALHATPMTESMTASARDHWALGILEEHSQFQLLCALRKGEQGVDAMNAYIEQLLFKQGLIKETGTWYAGRPVMITQNDYSLNLMNGDIGVTLPYHYREDGQARLGLRVAFLSGDGSQQIRWILPSRLQAHETVFAMTVHKSQGSEFTHTALMLPAYDNPILTRELIYTGITRAKRQFTLIDRSNHILNNAVKARVYRVSGL